MYGYAEYKEFVPLNVDEILKRVSQEDIMFWLTGETVVMKRKFKSPFRKDRNPGCHFWRPGKRILFADFADDRFHNKDCFALCMIKYGCDFKTALIHINNAFKLGLGTTDATEQVLSIVQYTAKKHVKKKTDIEYTKTPWHLDDKKYWSKIGVSRQQLEDDGVLRPSKIRLLKEGEDPVVIRPFWLCYVYTFPSGHVKIYSPYESKWKWITNTDVNDIGSYEFLDDTGELLIITKSYKDCRVLRNLGYQSIWVQNEKVRLPDSVAGELCNRFDRILLLYDNDRAGMDGAKTCCSEYNSLCQADKFIPVHYPVDYGVKDTAEFYEKHGKQKLLEILNEITSYY